MSPYHYIDLTVISQGTPTCNAPPLPLFTFLLPMIPYHPLLHFYSLSLHLHHTSCLFFLETLFSFRFPSLLFLNSLPTFHSSTHSSFSSSHPAFTLSICSPLYHLYLLSPPPFCSFSNPSTFFSCPLRLAKQNPTLSPSCFYQG